MASVSMLVTMPVISYEIKIQIIVIYLFSGGPAGDGGAEGPATGDGGPEGQAARDGGAEGTATGDGEESWEG